MRRLLVPAVLTAVLMLEAVASADVTGISVTSVRDLGRFAGKPYREAALRVDGMAPGGPYRVPAVLVYPARARDANGFGLVDPYNTAAIWIPGFPGEVRPLDEARLILGDDYLFGEGNVYLAVLWDKAVIEARREGFLAAGSDAYQVLRDAATLVRHPRAMPYPPGFRRPPRAWKVVAAGYSGSTNLLRDFYLHGENAREAHAFDGALFAGSGATCVSPAAPAAFYPCPGVVGDAGKVLVVNTEADGQFAGFTERGRTAGYRVQELAGIAHIPAAKFDFRALGQPEQNPVSASPAFRAAHTNLLRWITGGPPPHNRYLALEDVAPVDLGGFPFLPARRDTDGNAIGGIRLPHMPSHRHGRPAGAPLGTYTGLDLEDPNYFFLLSGTFTAFSAARLHELYATHETYVARVTRATDALLRHRHLLKPDRDAYIHAAEQLQVP